MKYLTLMVVFVLLVPQFVLASEKAIKVSEVSVIYNRNGDFYNFHINTQHGEPKIIENYNENDDPLWRMRVTTKQQYMDDDLYIPVAFKIEEYVNGSWQLLGYPEFMGTSPGQEAYLRWDNDDTDYYELFVTTQPGNSESEIKSFEKCSSNDSTTALPCCEKRCRDDNRWRLVCCDPFGCCRCGVCCIPDPQ
ncbi:hypothetical protein [Microbulbifer sp. 2205BS26-8]|uniref:hypothetical protein n=1 Tax=Microbulbifer sp. 2205BS26-8 TaxID=3064386 RepID=UPI00273F0C00|nr:hypothetical protein [Microbulbifer sp. 2205BS26-8]MDP5209031.1 hypothetical protein [Microbulbifer sp. 2205BS26-8]